MLSLLSISKGLLIVLSVCSAIELCAQDIGNPVTGGLRLSPRPHSTNPSAAVSVHQLRAPRRQQEQMREVRSLLTKGKTAEARKRVERVLSVSPDFADALSVRARINLRENRTAEALEDAQRSVLSDPQLPNAYFALGEILNHELRYEEALPNLERCISLAPESWPCHYERARALVGTDQVVLALESVEQAARLGGLRDEPEALYYLRGSIFILLREYGSGARDLTSFLKIQPTGPKAEQARLKLQLLFGKSNKPSPSPE